MKKFLIFFILILFFIPLVSATLTVETTEIGTDFITWSWDSMYNITSISIDGFNVYYFDTNSSAFTLSELDSESTHFIKIYSATDEGYNNATTNQSNISKLTEFLEYYVYFFIALSCLGVSISIRSPMIGFMGTVIMAISFIYNIIPLFYTGIGTMDMIIYGFGLMVSAVIGLALWR